jgi:hypothetical protein
MAAIFISTSYPVAVIRSNKLSPRARNKGSAASDLSESAMPRELIAPKRPRPA